MTRLDTAPVLNGGTERPLRGTTAGEVVRLAVGADVARLVQHDPIARIGEDPEGVHQARVAARRLRSQFETFAPVMKHSHCESLVRDLRWLGRRLGAVRDADVLLDRLAGYVRTFDPREREDAIALLERLEADRSKSFLELTEALARPRYRRLLERLVALIAEPPFRKRASLPAAPFLSDVVYERFAQLESAVHALPPLPSDAELHAVRITAKPLRYAAEAAAKVLGDSCARLGRRATDLCDELGSLNDGVRAIEWLERRSDDPRSLAVARLRSSEVARMAEARSSWRRRFSQVRDAAGAMHWPIEDGAA